MRPSHTFLPALISLALTAASSAAPGVAVVNPSVSHGIWEGWGCSLCWWANVFGTRDDLADIVFSMKTVTLNGQKLPGLGMTIARYNVGGCTSNVIDGQKIQLSPHIPAFKQIQGFWLDWNSADPKSPSWNWNADASQRAMLLKARARGADKFELFSNSPLWWMCVNHNPSGADNGSKDNLQDWNYRQYAVYLASVARHARDFWGINFDSVEPFNEPDANWWKATGTQEGCHFDAKTQAVVLGELRKELDALGMTKTRIAASDENAYDGARRTWESFDTATKQKVGRVNVHGYQGSGGRRDLLLDAVAGKPLWNSEYGEGEADGLALARNLTLDFRWLRPTAWCYWQPFDSGGWGLIQSNPADNWIGTANPKYFVLAQYTRHLRPGMTILDSGDDSTLAAYDAKTKILILVTLNDTDTSKEIAFDLSKFAKADGPVKRWTTEPKASKRYELGGDATLTQKTLRATLAAHSIQTLEIKNVTLPRRASTPDAAPRKP